MPLIEPQVQTISTANTSPTGLAAWPLEARMRNLAMNVVSASLSGTLTFQSSLDGGQSWVTLGCTKLSDGTTVSTTTGSICVTFPNAGYSHVRANATSYSSGAANVSLSYST
jgi:hypothetical protein